MERDEWLLQADYCYEFLAFYCWGFETYKPTERGGFFHIHCGEDERDIHLDHHEPYDFTVTPSAFIYRTLNKLSSFDPDWCYLFHASTINHGPYSGLDDNAYSVSAMDKFNGDTFNESLFPPFNTYKKRADLTKAKIITYDVEIKCVAYSFR